MVIRIFFLAAALIALVVSGSVSAEVEWKPLKHQDAQLTIISDHFVPDRFRIAKSFEAEHTIALLNIETVRSGVVLLARIFHESPWFDGISYVQGFR